jgi:hypothetical protein
VNQGPSPDDYWQNVDVSGASNVIVGPHGRQVIHYWRDPRTRILIILGALIAVAAVAVSTMLLWPESPHPSLELAAMEVAKPESIDGDVTGGEGDAPTPFHIGATAADITFKNNGSAPALITAADVQVLYAEQLDDCVQAGGGPSVITAHYTAKLPTPMPARPFNATRDMRFEVKGGSVDRMAFSLGPDHQNISFAKPYVIVAHVSFVHDKSSTPLDVGNIAIVTNTEAIERQATEPVKLSCVQANSKKLDAVYEIQATRSQEIDHLRDRYAEMTAIEPAAAQQRCQAWTDSPLIPRMCATYHQQELSVSLQLTAPPVADHTKFVVRLGTGDESQHFRIVAAWATEKWPPGPWWECSGIYNDTNGGEYTSRCDDNTTADLSTDLVLTIRAKVPLYFSYHSITLSTDVKDQISPKTYALVGSTPSDRGLVVERGN